MKTAELLPLKLCVHSAISEMDSSIFISEQVHGWMEGQLAILCPF